MVLDRIEKVIKSCIAPHHLDTCKRWIEDLVARRIVDDKEAERLNYIVQIHYSPDVGDRTERRVLGK